MNRQRLLPFVAALCLLTLAACRTADVAHPVGQELRYPPIVIYMKPGCPYCRNAEEYFTSRRIPFTRRDIVRDPAALREYRERHGEIVPLIVFGNDQRIVDGFDLPAIHKALRSFGLPADE